VIALRVHEGESMAGLKPVEDVLRIAVIGRGDKRNVVELKAKDLAHYRGNRARTGRVLPGTVKKVEGFE
jgi:hypothetical protein